jgi:hypothetical protein
MPLRERALEAFDSALERATASPRLSGLQDALAEARTHVDEPMRVAIVGQIKSGKSTLLNALLAEALVPTGPEELTFNVNWLKYGAQPSLFVHFRNGRAAEERTFQELELLTRRREENRDFLSSIRHIEVAYPNELLRTFNLIDTPGLESFFGEDSRNTLEFLRLTPEDLTEATRAESANADAIICLFSRGMATSDHSTVAKFQGPLLGQATPINAVGVLSNIDAYWPESDPLEEGRKIASRIEHEPEAERTLFRVLPVSGKLALGAQTLTDTEFDSLVRLTELPEGRLRDLIEYAEDFEARDFDDVAVPPAERAALSSRLGQYGAWEACRLLRAGTDLASLRDQLLECSGFVDLRELLVTHFGHRAFLIKLDNGLRKAKLVSFRDRQRLSGGDAEVAREVAGRLERLEAGEHIFAELALLREYYREGLPVGADEADELLRVTGEEGTTCAARLGLPETAPLADMLARAEGRREYWLRRADAFGADGRTMEAARVLTRSYERILYHVREARRHLELNE